MESTSDNRDIPRSGGGGKKDYQSNSTTFNPITISNIPTTTNPKDDENNDDDNNSNRMESIDLDTMDENTSLLWKEEDIQSKRLRRSSYLFFLVVVIVVVVLVFSLRQNFYDSSYNNRYIDPFTTSSMLGSNSLSYYDISSKCEAVSGGNPLPYFYWTPKQDSSSNPATSTALRFPLYYTHPIDQANPSIKHIVIVQHGNLRNGNDYFCAALASIQSLQTSSSTSSINLQEYLIIATQFLSDTDKCYDSDTDTYQVMDVGKAQTCNAFVWSSSGWKDGHANTNTNQASTTFSYDIFNLLVEQVTDPLLFPNLQQVVLFGFSAGAQTLLRHAMWPVYQSKNNKVQVRTVVSDMSTYLYLSNNRVREDESGQLQVGIPNESWLSASWKVS